MTERQSGVKGFLNNYLDACVSKYLYRACSVVSIKRYLHERDQISVSVVKEMALDVAPWCKQLEVCALLLACLSTAVLSCPRDCECGRENQMIYAECYDLSSMKSIPAGIPADTTTLVLYNTQISKIPRNAFQGLSNLNAISIQSNPLTSIDGNAFQGLTKLNELYLNRNNVTIVSKDSFKGLTQITRIDLSNNNLQTLPDGLYEDTVNLEKLQLDGNKITSISSNLLRRLGSLTYLSFAKNQISSIEREAFTAMASSLLTLKLDNNHLSEFPLESLKNFTVLNELFLENNHLTTIPLEAKQIFDEIAARQDGGIWISNNPLVCTKELQWLQTWMKRHSIIMRELDGVTCRTPFGNWSKVFDFDFSLLDLWPIPGDIDVPTSPVPLTMIASSSSVAPFKTAATSSPSSTASLTTTSVKSSTVSSTPIVATTSATSSTPIAAATSTTSSTPIAATTSITSSTTSTTTTSIASSVTTIATSSATSSVISATKSSTSHSSPSSTVMANIPETTTATTTVTSKTTDEATVISTALTSTVKETKTSEEETVTPGSKIAVSTKSIEQESGSQEKFFTRNQEVILSACAVGIFLIVVVAVALYFFRKKVLLRQKAYDNGRLPGMMYDRVIAV